jgi:hypothetical protein
MEEEGEGFKRSSDRPLLGSGKISESCTARMFQAWLRTTASCGVLARGG